MLACATGVPARSTLPMCTGPLQDQPGDR